jgi:O-antigen/teichoic acid export membrane protein
MTHYAPTAPEGSGLLPKRAAGWRLPEFVVVRGIGRGRDYALTFATELSSLAAGLIVLRLAAAYWGPAGFGEYVLARRIVGMVALPVLVGMALAVTRYVASIRAGMARHTERTYILSAVAIVGTTCAATLALFNIFARPLAIALFGVATFAPIVRAVALAIAGSALHGLAYGAYRGRLAMARANTLQFINLALVPLGCFFVPELNPAEVIAFIGSLWCFIAVIALIDLLKHSGPSPASRAEIRDAGRELLLYGGPRVPGELALGALFALPVTFAAHLGGIVVAGHVGLAISVLSMVGSLFSPLGHILLPAISGVSTGVRLLRIRVALRQLLALCFGLTVLFVLGFELLAAPVLRLIVGPDFASAVPAARIIVLAAPVYVIYIVLRNVLDALHVRPLNAKNLAIAVLVFTAVCLIAGGAAAVPWAVFSSLLVLGILSGWDAHVCLARGAAHDASPASRGSR